MSRGKTRGFVVALALTGALATAQQPTAHITVRTDKPGIRISPVFYGLMTEEINHAYDGGLYAELLRNRAFTDDRANPVHWSTVAAGGASGKLSLEQGDAQSPTAIRLQIDSADSHRKCGIANDGYWGIPVKPRTTFRASFYAKASPDFAGPLTVSIEADAGGALASATVAGLSSEWRKYTVQLRSGSAAASKANRFVVFAEHPGTVWLAHASLFPPTYRNRPNGNRIDLMEAMSEMRPAFLRLPGGNYLEGNSIAERFDWKKTVGPIEDRPGHPCPWGYPSSDGMGLLEYLEWCEDLRMQPVLAVFAGYALRGQHIDPGPSLAPFVQDALDEIEYTIGPTSSTWGAVRAKNGHPKPFPLNYVEIGNEDWFDRSGSYDGRFGQFYDAIKAKYPRLQIIATTGVKSRTPDLLDDHYYRSARDMELDSGHYDKISRTGPKIFVGEWACTEGSPTPTLHAALGDAAWLTGLERNSDLVVMESYAPLFVNVNPGASQWGTNLIGYDALSSFGSPSFYVQSMFAKNTGDVTLPAEIDLHLPPIAPPAPPHGAVGVGTNRATAEFLGVTVDLEGRKLLQSSPVTADANWSLGTGAWKIDGGALKQTSDSIGTFASTGQASWQDYSFTTELRRTSDSGGIAIYFHALDPSNNVAWTFGGGRGGQNQIVKREQGSFRVLARGPNVSLETGKTYRVRVELQGSTVRCFLDDRLVLEGKDTPQIPISPLYVAASRSNSSGDLIVKVVNVSDTPLATQLDLAGASTAEYTCRAWSLSGRPEDMNSIDQPEKVSPKSLPQTVVQSKFSQLFPAYSVTILRLSPSQGSGM